MYLEALINWIDRLKPDNRFTASEKTMWVNELESMIQQEALLIPPEIEYDYETDRDTELLAQHGHEKLYRHYLAAQISFANEEYDVYQNEMAMFNSAWNEFLLWICNRVKPAYRERVWLPRLWHFVQGETVTLSFYDLPFAAEELSSCTISIRQQGEEILSYGLDDLIFEADSVSVEIPQADSLLLRPGHGKVILLAVTADGVRYEQYPANRIKVEASINGSVIE